MASKYDPAVMQTLELAGVFALVGITVFLMRAHFANLDDAPLPLRLAVGFGVGALIGLFMLVRGPMSYLTASSHWLRWS